MPRRKDVFFSEEPFENGYGQIIKPNDLVMFISVRRSKVSYNTGRYAGKYIKDNDVASVLIKDIKSLIKGRSYVILPQKRIFKLQMN